MKHLFSLTFIIGITALASMAWRLVSEFNVVVFAELGEPLCDWCN